MSTSNKRIQTYPLLPLLVGGTLCMGSCLFAVKTDSRNKEVLKELNASRQTIVELEAKLAGLYQANELLHRELHQLRDSRSHETEIVGAPDAASRSKKAPLPSKQVYFPFPEPPSEQQLPSLPEGIQPPKPPQEVIEMMNQFPELDLESRLDQPNLIQEYSKQRSGNGKDDDVPPQNGRGTGIEEAMRQLEE